MELWAMTETGLFNRLRKPALSATRRIVVTSLIVMVSTFEICGLAGLRINRSASLPLGLYLVTAHPNANLVEFCPPEPFAQLAMERWYRDTGSCPDGGAPLLKPVVGRSGDLVEVSPQGIAVNGRVLPNTAPLKNDTKSRLTPWPEGRYTVGSDSVWVASTYNRRSFDSRYFGPVPSSSIRNYVRPWITFP
jgi:conjugative transfer signal peptidase TraF